MIRTARPSDLPAIEKIYAHARSFMAKTGNPRQWGDGYPQREVLEKDIEKGQLFVEADDETGLLHGVFAFILGEDPTYTVIEDGAWPNSLPYGTIHRIASDGQQSGLLGRCLAFCKARSRELRIDTYQDNLIMQKLVVRHGFVRCGIIHLENGSPRIAYQYSEKENAGKTAFSLPPYTAPDFESLNLDHAPDAAFMPAPKDKVAPENYHATTIFPEYFKVQGKWQLAKESWMDCVAVWDGENIQVKEFRRLKKGDLVFTGRTEQGQDGIFVHTKGFAPAAQAEKEAFSFRQGRSRETAFSRDYDEVCALLRHEKEQGKVVWVLGPAVAFDFNARNAFAWLIENGFVHAVLAGNALATHDLEGAYRKTALGQDIYTQHSQPMGHYNHIDTINRVRSYGSIPAFIEGEKIESGIIHACVKKKIPFVLTGSIRDDGPLPEVYADVYEGQDAMRKEVRSATTVISMATTLHSIATGNMTPSFRVLPDGTVRPVYFYSVDIAEFAVNKLSDRGSLSARGIVTNAQDFVVHVARGLGL